MIALLVTEGTNGDTWVLPLVPDWRWTGAYCADEREAMHQVREEHHRRVGRVPIRSRR